jgi:hypothetical protein
MKITLYSIKMVLNVDYSIVLIGFIQVKMSKKFGLLTQWDMVGRTLEVMYANADLACALCDNGG